MMNSSSFKRALETAPSLEDIGMTVAPLAPSQDMIEKGAAAGNIAPDTVRKIYEAMLETYRLQGLTD